MELAKILFVDDEDFVLKAICRFFCETYEVHSACNGETALRMLTEDRSYAAVVADKRMPGMSGIEFLGHAHKLAPQTTRILLTGHLEPGDALRAVNEGHVFQILLKPCPVAVMQTALQDAVRFHQSTDTRTARLEESLRHSTIEMLCDILKMVSPDASSRAARIRELALEVAEHLGVKNCSEIETTAVLSQFGCIDVLPGVLASGEELPLSARILRAVNDFEAYTAQQRLSPQDALVAMSQHATCYDPKVLNALTAMNHLEARSVAGRFAFGRRAGC